MTEKTTGREGDWDRVYRDKFNTMWYPNEDVVRFCARLIRKRLDWDGYDVRRTVDSVLDLGCGNGRHVVFFAEQGFHVSGVDVSRQAIAWAEDWCRRRGLRADLRVGDATRLPWGDGKFDVVVSHGVLDHMPMSDARRTAEEVRRVLKPAGLFYCDLRSAEDSDHEKGETIGPNTYRLAAGYEAGLVQHFFTMEEVGELLSGLFQQLYLECNERRFGADLGEKSARWVIAAERLSARAP